MKATDKYTITVAAENIQKAKSDLEDAMNAQQEFFDEKSEKWQEGEKGTALAALIETLQECIDGIDEIDDKLGGLLAE